MKRVKLSKYAKLNGISYMTAYRHFKAGNLKGIQLPTKTILVDIEDENNIKEDKVAIYCRVSSSQNKKNLKTQRERLYNYCIAKGYKIDKIVEEVGSGINDNRKKWIELLTDTSITKIVVEHKDRFSRFGFNVIEKLLELQNRKIEVVNNSNDKEDDILQDFISIITSYCSRIYGNKRSKRKTEKIIEELNK